MKIKNKLLILTTVSIFNNIAINSFAVSQTTNIGFAQQFADNTISIEDISLDTSDLDSINVPIKNFGCSAEINEILSKIEYFLIEYKSNKNLVYLSKTIELFGDIAIVSTEDDLPSFEYDAPVYNIFKSIRDEIYNIETQAVCSEYLVEFGKSILFGWRKNKISSEFPHYFLVEGLVEYNTLIDNSCILAQNQLDILYMSYVQMINTDEANTDSEELPELPTLPDTEYEPLPPVDFDDGEIYVPDDSESNVNEDTSSESYSYNNEYKKVGNSCILIETKYKDGLSFEQSKKPVPKEDYVYCGIYDYIFDNTIHNNFGNSLDNSTIDEEYINNDQNKESNMYIYYTVSKNSFTPYYYNTGIRTTNQGVVSYNQLKDALYQVAVKSNGFSTDTNDKSLSIIEGIPIVVDSSQDTYSKSYVEKLLDSFKNVGFKIQKDAANSKSYLEKLISNNEIITMKYNDQDIQIDNLKIRNSFIIAPIKTISILFDHKVVLNDSELLITKNDFTLKIMINENKYILNNKEFVLENPVVFNSSNNEYYMDISYLFELLGYDINWDSENLYFEVEDK